MYRFFVGSEVLCQDAPKFDCNFKLLIVCRLFDYVIIVKRITVKVAQNNTKADEEVESFHSTPFIYWVCCKDQKRANHSAAPSVFRGDTLTYNAAVA